MRSRIQTLLKSWLFQASICNCLNCVRNCDDQSSLDGKEVVNNNEKNDNHEERSEIIVSGGRGVGVEKDCQFFNHCLVYTTAGTDWALSLTPSQMSYRIPTEQKGKQMMRSTGVCSPMIFKQNQIRPHNFHEWQNQTANKNDKDLRSKIFLTFEHWHMEIAPSGLHS